MKYGIFSDVHGNLEAFEAVLEAFHQENVESYIFLGDIVGYGAEPKKCIQILKDLIDKSNCICVAGNHDYAACGLTETENFVHYAKEAISWTKDQLEESDKEFLAQMKLVHQEEDFTIVHANLVAPEKWHYIFDIDDAYPNFKLLQKQICFIAHSHKPVIFVKRESVDWFVEEKIEIQKDAKYIINVGSVGQPRDENPKSSFAIYDTDAGLLEIRRCDYDIKMAQKKIVEAGLPSVLAERLSLGK